MLRYAEGQRHKLFIDKPGKARAVNAIRTRTAQLVWSAQVLFHCALELWLLLPYGWGARTWQLACAHK